ncbi:hypothetical protein [Ralstonia pseudosolanacearum]|uniref:hypothetical protein n=1 Tax=Ralstonia pseudosolanacearum TaxID=1310165 RepID=UPI003CEAE222
MNQRQAMRIALGVNASYILFGAATAVVTDGMSEEDAARYESAQKKMAEDMLKRAGLDHAMSAEEIISAVLASN